MLKFCHESQTCFMQKPTNRELYFRFLISSVQEKGKDTHTRARTRVHATQRLWSMFPLSPVCNPYCKPAQEHEKLELDIGTFGSNQYNLVSFLALPSEPVTRTQNHSSAIRNTDKACSINPLKPCSVNPGYIGGVGGD